MPQRFDIFSETKSPFLTEQESADYLNIARDKFGVLNLSYWFLGAANWQSERMTWLSTYDQRYMNIYRSQMSPLGDPAFKIGFTRYLPIDWAEVRSSHDEVKPMHEIAESYGVGRQGISVPIREPGIGDAMFSVNFECDDRHWTEVRQDLVTSIHLFAHYFHLRMHHVIRANTGTGDMELAPREREVLKWAAEGKTAWETAQLLKVSERAIRLYTENAINKLRAKTKTQAVAIAVKYDILN